ncbi:hypothetical protein ACFU5Y_04095 [Streptomyces gardneri]|uniref:hypothetical protein n=1 Tax=Streptomyces gardneri TaxID=66892 RepID=UPI0036AE8295
MTTRRTTPKTLEPIYNVKQAARKLGLATDHKPNGGVRFLRDGANRESDPFPCTRMNNELQFSESQLAEIWERYINAPNTRTGRPRKKRVVKRAATKPLISMEPLALAS